MGRYLSIPILFIAVVLQSTALPALRSFGGTPDLILMLVLSWALMAGGKEALWWAVIGGVLQDIVSGTPTGMTAIPLVMLVFGIDLILGPIGRDNWVIPPIVAGVATLLYHIALIGLLTIIGRPMPILIMLQRVTLPTLALNVLFMIPVYRLMGALFQATRPRRVTL